MPDVGMSSLMSERMDTHEPEITRWYNTQFSENNENDRSTVSPRVRSFQEEQELYRPLQPGELEISSKGLAQAYMSERPILDERAGIIKRWMNQDELESGAKAPLHRRVLHHNRSNAIGDEERFGTVKRPASGSNTETQFFRVGTGFAKEHLRILSTGIASPAKLIDVREGNVMDDSGKIIRSGDTGKPLRHLGRYFTSAGQTCNTSIDEDGNVVVSAPFTAQVGGIAKFPAGDLQIQVGKSVAMTANQRIAMSAQDITFLPGLSLLGGKFNIGTNASEPAILGQQLLVFLQTLMDLVINHTHIGNLGGLTVLDPVSRAALQLLKTSYLSTPLPTRPLIQSENIQWAGKVS